MTKSEKQLWEMTSKELGKWNIKQLKMAGAKLSDKEIEQLKNPTDHKYKIQNAVKQNKFVPFKVLKEYAGEEWADKTIARKLKGIRKVNLELFRAAQKAKNVDEFISKISKGKPETVSVEVLTDFYNTIVNHPDIENEEKEIAFVRIKNGEPQVKFPENKNFTPLTGQFSNKSLEKVISGLKKLPANKNTEFRI